MNPSDQQALTALSKGAAQAALEPITDLLKSLLGPAADELGAAFKDRVRIWRVERAARFFRRAEEFLRPLGIEARQVPLRLLLGTIEDASMEEDDSLQDRWAALLVNAARPDSDRSRYQSYMEVLRQLSASDATFLDALFLKLHDAWVKTEHLASEPITARGLQKVELGNERTLLTLFSSLGLTVHDASVLHQNERRTEHDVTDFHVTLDTLVRLNLLSRDALSRVEQIPGSSIRQGSPIYRFTALGFEFVRASRPPVTLPESSQWHGRVLDGRDSTYVLLDEGLTKVGSVDEAVAKLESELKQKVPRGWRID